MTDLEFIREFNKRAEAFLDNEKTLPVWSVVAADATLRFKVDREKGTVKVKYERRRKK